MSHWILWGSAIILCAVAAALFVPVRIRIGIGPGRGIMIISYLLWSLRRNILTGEKDVLLGPWVILKRRPRRREKPRQRKKTGQPVSKEKEYSIGTRMRRQGNALWTFRVALRRTLLIVARLIGRLIRSWRLQEARIALTIGLGDPAGTGMATGLFYALQPALQNHLRRWQVSLQPDFNQPTLKVEADFTLRMLPVAPVRHLLHALGTLPYRELWKLRKVRTT